MPASSPSAFEIESIAAGLPAAALVDPTRALSGNGPLRLVVEAPPGTGKTTVVPPLISELCGRTLVTQPRRIAARAAAARLAQLSGTEVGGVAGYTVRGDRRTSAATRVEFATTGVLIRRLLADPELAGVDAVVLDEVHERSLDSDLAVGMLAQLAELRDDLSLVVMSATLDAALWANLIGDGEPAPVVSAASVLHPLEERWAPPAVPALDARGVTPDFLRHVARTVADSAAGSDGDVLVFLPGQREIDRVAGELRGTGIGAEVLTLTGRTHPREQDRILRRRAGDGLGGPRTDSADARTDSERSGQRIVLATDVAESALTVPGVRTVVDAGLSREPRLDTIRGMTGLVTVGASKAAMVQRAGRAAREAPGAVVRCMAQADFAARAAETPPEVATTDLTQAVLDLACFGAPRGEGLRLPTPLPERALAAAESTLTALGALDDGQATDLGHRLATVPADPRLARALLDGAELVGAQAAAEVVAALVADERAPGGDVEALLHRLRRERPQRWRDDARRFSALAGDAGGQPAEDAAGLITALAYPDRIARRRSADSDEYLLASGTAATLPRDSGLRGHAWLAVAEVGLASGRALIRAAAPVSRETAELAGAELLVDEETAVFDSGRVRARRVSRLGAIELSSAPCRPSAEAGRAAVAAALSAAGLAGFFALGVDFEALRGRIGLLRVVYGDPWPDVSLEALSQTAGEWLAPELDAIAGGAKAGSVDLASALRRMLPWPEAGRLDELVPERVSVPSGSTAKLAYAAPEEHGDGGTVDEPSAENPDGEGEGSTSRAADVVAPVLAVKLQECFGWAQGPTVCEGRVPVLLHLLSPARRPLAVTQDLASFWDGAYAHVRAENRGRYPKHPWPEDPWTAQATAKTKRRMG